MLRRMILCARQQVVFRKLDELDSLIARNRRKSFEEILNRAIPFEVVDQRLHRNSCALETGLAAHPLRVHPDDLIEDCLLFGRH